MSIARRNEREGRLPAASARDPRARLAEVEREGAAPVGAAPALPLVDPRDDDPYADVPCTD